MRRPLAITAAIAAACMASSMVSGCAGIPTAFTLASAYVNSVLVLRTDKGMTDHLVSAVANRDCGLLNLVDHGSYCTDAPPAPLLAALAAGPGESRPIRSVAPVVADEPAQRPQVKLTVAAATLSDTPAGLAAPQAPLVVAAPAGPSAPRAGTMIVLGSYRHRDMAAGHLARLHRADGAIVSVQVAGKRFYRVVVRTPDRSTAQRELAELRSGGVFDAWVIGGAASGNARPALGPAPRSAPGPATSTVPSAESAAPQPRPAAAPELPLYAAAPVEPVL